MNLATLARPSVFVDISPRSLYRSLVELKIRVIGNSQDASYEVSFPSKFKIIVLESDGDVAVGLRMPDNLNVLRLSSESAFATIQIGEVTPQSGGGPCDDSGWTLYPLMSAELNLSLTLSPYKQLALRVVPPENCHVYCSSDYSFVEVSHEENVRRYHFPEQADPSRGDTNPYRLKSCFEGYPTTRFVPFLVDEGGGETKTNLSLNMYLREAFIFHVISVFTPVLYGIPLIALWAYSGEGFDASKKIPIMIAIIPFYIGLWYRSNIMKSVPTVTNFLTFLYVFLYLLFVVYAIVLSTRADLQLYLFAAYGVVGALIFFITTAFCVTPVQRSPFLRFIKKTIEILLKPFELLFQSS